MPRLCITSPLTGSADCRPHWDIQRWGDPQEFVHTVIGTVFCQCLERKYLTQRETKVTDSNLVKGDKLVIDFGRQPFDGDIIYGNAGNLFAMNPLCG